MPATLSTAKSTEGEELKVLEWSGSNGDRVRVYYKPPQKPRSQPMLAEFRHMLDDCNNIHGALHLFDALELTVVEGAETLKAHDPEGGFAVLVHTQAGEITQSYRDGVMISGKDIKTLVPCSC